MRESLRKKLVKYQLKKFKKCTQCFEPVATDCKTRCANCGWEPD